MKFTQIANDDLDRICQYITGHLKAEKVAVDLMDDFEAAILGLREFPYSSSPVTDEILNSRGYRKLIVKNYIVFHLVDESERQVVIMRVLYGAQQCENLL